jgi:hypothetical protein
MALEIAAHDLPPVVALLGLHVDELNAYLPFSTMADHRAHLQLSGGTVVMNTEMNFDFCAYGVLNLTQNAYANWTQVRQETGHKLAGRTEQNTPIGSASGAGPPFGKWIVGQLYNQVSAGRRNISGPTVLADSINDL